MKKVKELKGFILGFIVCFILTNTIAFAAPIKKTISVLENKIGLIIDGVQRNSSQQSFIYNGSIYVPVDSITKHLGKKATYDGKNGKLYISNTGSIVKGLKEVDLFTKAYVEGSKVNLVNIDKERKKIDFSMNPFMDGTEIGSGIYTAKYSVVYPLNSLATQLSGSIGTDDCLSEMVVSIYDENGRVLYKSGKIKSGMDDIKFNVDVKNVLKVKIEFDVKKEYSIGCDAYIKDLKILTTDY